MASTEHQQLRIPLLTDSEGSSGSWGLLDASGVSSLGGPVEAEAHAVASRLWCTCLAGLAGRRLDRLINSRWFYRGVALWLLTALAVGFAGSHYFTEGFRLSVLPPARNERLKDAWNHGAGRRTARHASLALATCDCHGTLCYVFRRTEPQRQRGRG